MPRSKSSSKKPKGSAKRQGVRSGSASSAKPFRPVFHFLKTFFRLGLCAGGVLGVAGVLGVVWLDRSLPPLKQFSSRVRVPSVIVQAFDGTTLATYGDLYEEYVTTEDLPPYVVNAFLAVEDRRFFQHKGIDFIGLARAAARNFYAHRIVQGGSTLTQQLAKNMLMSNGFYAVTDRSYKRKFQELILAIKLEATFSKNEILTLYLNRVYFGAGTFGIDAAARRYFHKPGRQLSLFEAAILAGLLRAPSKYSPLGNPQRSIERGKIVLKAMETSGFIGAQWQERIEAWSAEFIRMTKEATADQGSRYFADWIYETLPSLIGPIDQDLVVVTTLHPEMQHVAEETCRSFYTQFHEEYKFSQVASMAMTPDGAILTMVGGLDYGKSQFNRATSALRQPGSSFKTFVYLAGLDAGMTPETMVDDSPYEQGSWKPGNYKWRTRGEISLLTAYVYSVNSVSIRVAKEVGVARVIQTARRLGITTPLNPNLALALGASSVTFLEMMRAYAPFFNYGTACQPYGVYEIRNKNGDIVYQHADESPVRVIRDSSLSAMSEMMRAVVARGSGRAANVDSHIGGKTGSNGSSDAWFMGGREPTLLEQDLSDDEFSPRGLIDRNGLVLGVWIGNDRLGQKMAPMSTGGRIPTRIAGALFKAYLKKTPRKVVPLQTAVGGGTMEGASAPSAASSATVQLPSVSSELAVKSNGPKVSVDQLLGVSP